MPDIPNDTVFLKFYNQCLCFELVHFQMCPANLELSNFGLFLSA